MPGILSLEQRALGGYLQQGTLETKLGVGENRPDLLIARLRPGAQGPQEHPKSAAKHI